MSNYSTLKTAIQQVIKTNGNNEITGELLQQSLLSIINSLGAEFQFAGVATPSTNPGTPDQNVAYMAGPGTYSNFGGFIIDTGKIGILKYNGTWELETVSVGGDYDKYIFGNKTNVNLSSVEVGLLKADGTIDTSVTTQYHTDYISLNDSKNIRITHNGYVSTGFPTVVFYNNQNEKVGDAIINPGSGNLYPIPDGATKIRVGITTYYYTYRTDIVVDLFDGSGLLYRVSKLETDVLQIPINAAAIENANEHITALEKNVYGDDLPVDISQDEVGLLQANGTINTSVTNYYHTDFIPLVNAAKIKIIHNGYVSNTFPTVVFYDKQDAKVGNVIANPASGASFDVPENAFKIRVGINTYYHTNRDKLQIYQVEKSLRQRIGKNETDIAALQGYVDSPQIIYVKTTGNDTTGDGSAQYPFKTINKAISFITKPGATILIGPGDYKETLDFNLLNVSKVSLRPISETDVVRIHGANFFNISALSGHTNIYTVGASLIMTGNSEYIAYVDGKKSLPTTAQDMFPQMSGAKYRLPFTEMTNRLTKNYTTLADALAFMESQNEECLWYDSANQIIYMYSPDDLTQYQLAIPSQPTWKLITGENSNKFEIQITRIGFYYPYTNNQVTYTVSGLDSLNLGRCELIRCKFMGGHTSGVTNRASYNLLIGCEAGGNGNDGFSGSFYANDYNINADIDHYIEYRDCWAHDNYDDGFTDHVRGKVCAYNCLSSYNYLGDGFHFVSGSQLTAINCIAYGNGSHGFVNASGTDDGRLAEAMELFNCVAISSKTGFAADAAQNLDTIMSCFNCKSIGNQNGYLISGNGTKNRVMNLYDCTSLNDTTPKSNTSTDGHSIINVYTTTPIV